MDEQYENEAIEIIEEPKLTITETAVTFLVETGKWTKFLSIIGFILTGVIVIMAFFAGSLMSMVPNSEMGGASGAFGVLLGGMYLLMGLLYFFPAFYLFKFSQKLKLAIDTKNNEALDTAFSNQKSFYKFWGILTGVMVAFYVLFGFVAFIIGMVA